MSGLGDAVKDIGAGWGSFPKDLASDTKSLTGSGWKKGTTLRQKNAYRLKLALLAAAIGVGAFVVTGSPWALAPIGLTVIKLWIILNDKK